jgi:hypothetical protein
MAEQKTRQLPRLQVGQPFNPFRLFAGIFIPEALVRFKDPSADAKLAYGRLARYAGQDGDCFPAVATLASEIGVCVRQAQNYPAQLERKKFLRRITRFVEIGQTSNTFEFLWHSQLEGGGEESCTPGGERSCTGG